MKKLFYIAVLVILISPECLLSQDIDYEFVLWAGGGIAGLSYAPVAGGAGISKGFQAGIGYVYFPRERWGIVAGLEVASYNTKAYLRDDITIRSSANDPITGERFEWRVQVNGYEERQAAYTLNVPLKLHFQTFLRPKIDFYTQVGMKVAFPMTTYYAVSSKTLETTGYYLSTGKEENNNPDKGFGTLTNWNQQGIFTFRVSYSTVVEAGIKYVLSDDLRFYLGVYFDYGFNNAKREETYGNVFLYRPGSLSPRRPGSSIVNIGSMMERIHLMALGVKVSLAFGGTEQPLKFIRYYQCRCGQ